MADVIPSSDPALLAAQAKGGQAGVDAYQAAVNSLQQQRQQAVQQAMQEAALRGAPGGAIPSIQSTITSPYDTGIANLTQGGASYQASMAARDQRMADYQANVQSARSFIPLQTEQQLAPIRAQNEYNLHSQQIASDRAIGSIEAETALQLARMQAAEVAAKIAAAKKAAADAAKQNTLNQGELQAMLGQGAQSILGRATSSANDILSANQRAVQQTGQAALGPIGARAAKDQSAAYTSLVGSGVLALMLGGGGAAGPASAAAAGRAAATDQQSGQYNPLLDPNRQAQRQAVSERQAAERQGQIPQAPPPTPVDTVTPQRTANIQAIQGASDRAQMMSRNALQRFMQSMGGVLGQATRNVSSFVNGQQILATPQQLSTLQADTTNPLGYSLLTGSGHPIIGPADYNQFVVGDPTRDIQATLAGLPSNAGVAPSYSVDAVRAAYEKAAEQLGAQGYQFTGPEAMNAMPNKFSSIYDLLNSQSSQDTYRQMVAQGATLDKSQTKAQTEADKAKATSDLVDAGWNPNTAPKSMGDVVDAANFVLDPNNQRVIATAIAQAQQTITGWDKTKSGTLNANSLRQALVLAGVDPLVVDAVIWNLGI